MNGCDSFLGLWGLLEDRNVTLSMLSFVESFFTLFVFHQYGKKSIKTKHVVQNVRAYFMLYIFTIKWITCVQEKTELSSRS